MASVGEVIRVATHYVQAGGGDIMNVFHFRIAGSAPSDESVLEDMTIWLDEEWGARWRVRADQNCTLSHFEIDVVNPDGTVARNIGGAILGIAGAVAGGALPAGNAGYLLAYTAIPKARGSKYVPGVSETDSAASGLSVEYIANLALLLAVYLAPIVSGNGATYQPGVLSKTLEAFVPFLVSGAIDNLVAYQRRRKLGVGI